MPSNLRLPSSTVDRRTSSAGESRAATGAESIRSVDLTRRGFLVGLGGTAALGLVACGSDASGGAPSGAAGSGDVSRAAGSAFPVTVQHKYGSTVVPASPKRVVSVGVTEQDTLLALGVKPVGVTDWYGDQPYATWPWAQKALGDATPTVLKAPDGFEFEKIAALRPDLIVGTNSGMKQSDYDKLTVLAPTIPQSGKYTDYFEPWYVQSLAIGTAVGKKAEVQKIIAGIDARFAAAEKANPEFTGTRAIFLQNAVSSGNLIAYQKGLSTDFLTKLGLVVPAGLEKYSKDGGQAYIPLEHLDELNAADVLIWATEKDSDRMALEKVPGFQQLDAVRAGRSIYTGGELSGAIYFTSPLSLPYVIDRLAPMLAKVL